MYACIPEIGCGFFEGECRKRIGHLLFATHACRPTLCSGTKLAPPSAPITNRNLLHDLPREEALLLNTSLNRGPSDGSAAIVSS